MSAAADYEKLGVFYLGREYDIEAGQTKDAPILYDAKDLTTHAMCVGMTGSGKTGLGIALIEEAAIDGIPVIAIDPKGDLGTLLLTFPDLEPADFRAWIDEGEAARKGRTADEHAKWTADLWRKGLADWGEDGERIARFRDAADAVIYTPGSTAGVPMSVLRSFGAPPPAALADEDVLRDRIQAGVSGLLGLLGVSVDPLRSREHILLSTILDNAWREGRDLDLPSLIREIQSPPFERVGVFDLEAFFPGKDRFELAMMLNNLVASPGFGAWMEGEPLDVGRLLYTADGKPRLSIVSIAHLSESERMFFVTLLLNEVVSWVRSQPGSRSLRAILYMDEVFGYFPPSANPPSKKPMLTLLKQARAYGLGVVLATQNPVDLDYKGLSNCGTWFLGRLQTERDKARVIEGLEGANAAAGASFDRARMEKILAGLGERVFLMNNVHEDEPVVFTTRWVLSYLGGPLTREQIKRLTAERAERGGEKTAVSPGSTGRSSGSAASEAADGPGSSRRPALPPDVPEAFMTAVRTSGSGAQFLYRPALLGVATLHYSKSSANVDEWRKCCVLTSFADDDAASPWEEAGELPTNTPSLDDAPAAGARFADLPAAAARPESYKRWAKMLESELYQSHPLVSWECKALKTTSRPGESEAEFRGRLRERVREERDLQLERLRDRYAPKLASLQDQIQRAEQRVEVEQDQYKQRKTETAISIGATVLGALFGRKLGSVGNIGRASTSMRSAGRAARERGDIDRAEEKVETLKKKLADMEAELEEELSAVRDETTAKDFDCEEVPIRFKKSDSTVDRVLLVWVPWIVASDGSATVAY